MIGQTKLKSQFNMFTQATLPHAMMFVGGFGCGKHTFCREIASQFKLNVIEITEKVNIDLVDSINGEISPTLCILDADDITLKEESVLLKFIEEPSSNVYIALLCKSTTTVLSTILNRCHVYRFVQYSPEELHQFCIDTGIECDEKTLGLLYSIADTPGKIISWKSLPLTEMYEYASKILALTGKSTAYNLFNITKKISFKDDTSYPVIPFVTILSLCSRDDVIANKNKATLKYSLTKDLYNAMLNKPIFPQQTFENYLYRLKEIG